MQRGRARGRLAEWLGDCKLHAACCMLHCCKLHGASCKHGAAAADAEPCGRLFVRAALSTPSCDTYEHIILTPSTTITRTFTYLVYTQIKRYIS